MGMQMCAVATIFLCKKKMWAYRGGKPQHQRGHSQQKREGDPRVLMMEDLKVDLKLWHEKGDQLVVLGDFNSDVRSLEWETYFNEFGMHEALMDYTRQSHLAPETKNTGSKPIDGIFISKSMMVKAGGYSGYDEMGSDHRYLWLDLSITDVFQQSMPHIVDTMPGYNILRLFTGG